MPVAPACSVTIGCACSVQARSTSVESYHLMKIIVADDLPASALDLLRSEGWNVDARSGRPPAELAADLADADALVVRSATKVTADLIAAAPRLRAIARAGTGVDNVDVAAASARGIVVMNAPGANSISVAELTMALMLALARKIPGRRRVDEAGQVGQEELSRRRGARQGPRARRPRPHRPGSGAARPRVRDERHRPRSVHQRAASRATCGIELVSLDELCAARRLPLAAHAGDARDAAHLQRRAAGARARRAFASSTRRAAT